MSGIAALMSVLTLANHRLTPITSSSPPPTQSGQSVTYLTTKAERARRTMAVVFRRGLLAALPHQIRRSYAAVAAAAQHNCTIVRLRRPLNKEPAVGAVTVSGSHRFYTNHNSSSTTMNMEKFALAERFNQLRPNVWAVFAKLAQDNQPLANLGSGYPDVMPPDFVKNSLLRSAMDPGLHQETDSLGHPRLVKALLTLYSTLLRREMKPEEFLIVAGAYEGLFATFYSLLDPGDEAILIEPYFDCYEAMCTTAGAVPIFVTMRPNSSGNWTIDMSELRSAFTSRTKMVVLNTPHNPVGKVFSRQELTAIASLCCEHDVVVVMDEVYEWSVFDGEHVRMASLPGMWERTITIGSAGKSFGVTGWRIGWVYGPADLMGYLQRVHLVLANSCWTPIQEAVALAIERELSMFGRPDSYWSQLPQTLKSKCDRLCSILEKAGFRVFRPQAGFFVVVDFSEHPQKPMLDAMESISSDSSTEEKEAADVRFARWLCEEKKVLAIPPSCFYSLRNAGEAKNLLRFCFFKESETLDHAEKNLLS